MSAMAIDKDNKRAQSVHVAKYDLSEPCATSSNGTTCRFYGRILRHRVVQPLELVAALCRNWVSRCRNHFEVMHNPWALMASQTLTKSKRRLRTSPMTYESTCFVMRFSIGLATAVPHENLEASLFWKVPMVRQFIDDIGGFMVYF